MPDDFFKKLPYFGKINYTSVQQIFRVSKPHQDVRDVRVDLVPVVTQPDVVEQRGLVEVHQAAVVVNVFLLTEKIFLD